MAGWHATWGIAHTRIAYKLFSLGKAAEKGVVTTYHRISEMVSHEGRGNLLIIGSRNRKGLYKFNIHAVPISVSSAYVTDAHLNEEAHQDEVVEADDLHQKEVVSTSR